MLAQQGAHKSIARGERNGKLADGSDPEVGKKVLFFISRGHRETEWFSEHPGEIVALKEFSAKIRFANGIERYCLFEHLRGRQ